jgi:type IV pilus assembly protein PilC
MPTFTYAARTAAGETQSGTLEANDQGTAVRLLRERGLVPTSIAQSAGGGVSKAPAKKRKGKGGACKIDDLCVMAQQMSVMIRAGLPLIEVLDILSDQTERIVLANALRQIEKDVSAGSSFTEALQKHPAIFNQFFISMVKAGEASGMLDSILDQVATYLERIASLQRKIKSAIMYPATVSTVAIGITIFLLVKVVPVFEVIFDKPRRRRCRGPTKITLACSKFLQNKWYILFSASSSASTSSSGSIGPQDQERQAHPARPVRAQDADLRAADSSSGRRSRSSRVRSAR